jgi:hypothetical protein
MEKKEGMEGENLAHKDKMHTVQCAVVIFVLGNIQGLIAQRFVADSSIGTRTPEIICTNCDTNEFFTFLQQTTNEYLNNQSPSTCKQEINKQREMA